MHEWKPFLAESSKNGVWGGLTSKHICNGKPNTKQTLICASGILIEERIGLSNIFHTMSLHKIGLFLPDYIFTTNQYSLMLTYWCPIVLSKLTE